MQMDKVERRYMRKTIKSAANKNLGEFDGNIGEYSLVITAFAYIYCVHMNRFVRFQGNEMHVLSEFYSAIRSNKNVL